MRSRIRSSFALRLLAAGVALSLVLIIGISAFLLVSRGQQTRSAAVTTSGNRAQVIGQLFNAIFLDVIDEDVVRMERLNEMIRKLDAQQRDGFRPIDLLVLRPSQDLGKLAAGYEPQLPRAFRFLTRSLGTRETSNADFLSLLMFVPEYLGKLIDVGEADGEARMDEVAKLLAGL